MCGDIGAGSGRDIAGSGKCSGVDAFTGTSRVGHSAVVGALDFDVERGQIVVVDVHGGRIVGRIVPHAVVGRD